MRVVGKSLRVWVVKASWKGWPQPGLAGGRGVDRKEEGIPSHGNGGGKGRMKNAVFRGQSADYQTEDVGAGEGWMVGDRVGKVKSVAAQKGFQISGLK